MYFEGSCEGSNALLDIIKEKAVDEGWEVLRDESVAFDDLPSEFENCLVTSISGDYLAMKNHTPAAASADFYVTLPRARTLKNISLENANSSTSVSVWGVDVSQNQTLLCENIAQNSTISNDTAFYRYHISAQSVGELKFGFKESGDILKRTLNLKSTGKNGLENIFINLEAFIYPDDLSNIIINSSSSFSPEVATLSQTNALGGVICGYDKSIAYFGNINKNRLIIATRIYDSEDAKYKNPVTQLGYFGKAYTYGGDYAFSNANIGIAPTTDKNKRWSDCDEANFDSPKVYIDSIMTFSSNMGGWNDESMNIAPYPNGDLFCTNVVLYDNSTLLGELDGLQRVIGEGVNTGDTVSLEGQEYCVVANGKSNDKWHFYAMIKD